MNNASVWDVQKWIWRQIIQPLLMNQCLLKWNDKYKKYKYQYFKLDRRVHFVWFLKWSCPLALYRLKYFIVFIWRKKVINIWDDMRVSKWWENLNFWVNYSFEQQDVMQRLKHIPDRIQECVELMRRVIELKHTTLMFWKATFLLSIQHHCLKQGRGALILSAGVPAEFSSNLNQTHLKQLIKVFRIQVGIFFQGWS